MKLCSGISPVFQTLPACTVIFQIYPPQSCVANPKWTLYCTEVLVFTVIQWELLGRKLSYFKKSQAFTIQYWGFIHKKLHLWKNNAYLLYSLYHSPCWHKKKKKSSFFSTQMLSKICYKWHIVFFIIPLTMKNAMRNSVQAKLLHPAYCNEISTVFRSSCYNNVGL